MHIVSCEHPQRIFNKYVKEWLTVPCGKCKTCRQRRANRWVSRLEVERSCWKYTIFFTLTYSEDFVPYLELQTVDTLLHDSPPTLLGVRTSSSFNQFDFEELDDDSKAYIFRVKKIRVLNTKDVQNFLKRFRYHVKEKLNSCFATEVSDYSDSCFRYYIIGEYGETTLRPHYHGLIFTNSEFIRENFEDLLTSAWSVYDRVTSVYRPIGKTDWSFVVSSASSYCAQYLNCTYNLPRFFADTKLRPFSLESRRPPIGSMLQSSSQLLSVFNKGLTHTSFYSRQDNKFVSLSLPTYLQNRLFPKCPRFGALFHHVRVTAYGMAIRFDRFKEWHWYGEEKDERYYAKEFLKEVGNDSCEWNLFNYLNELTCHFVDVSAFIRLLRLSRRVLTQCAVFQVSLDYYVSRIELYYSNLQSYNNKMWFDMQEHSDPSNVHPLDFVSADFDFVDSFVKGLVEPSDYGLPEVSDVFELDYTLTFDYQSMCRDSFIKYVNTSKTKKKNDYLEAHPEKCIFVYG